MFSAERGCAQSPGVYLHAWMTISHACVIAVSSRGESRVISTNTVPKHRRNGVIGSAAVQGKDATKELLEREENAALWQKIYDVTLAKMTDTDSTEAFEDEAPPASPFAGMQTGA